MRYGPAPCELTPLEVASGLVFGFMPPEQLPASIDVESQTPREALERAILPALLRPPCLMSFSGGRGSSVILAIAVQLARREGLELPVPATLRMNGSAGAEELASQERVVIRLGLTEWLRLEFHDELDYVGPVATAALRRYGLLWPSDAHVWMPLIEWAFGGSLITGVGHRKANGDLPALLHRDPRPLPWLQPSAQREVRAQWVVDAVSRRRAEQRHVGWWLRLRQVEVRIDLLRRLGAERRVDVRHPLLDPAFSAVLGAQAGRSPSGRLLLGDLLPPEVMAPAPSDMTTSGLALWSSWSRELIEDWDGQDVDPGLVDIEALKLEWSLPRPDPRTSMLLQSVALERERRAAEVLGANAG